VGAFTGVERKAFARCADCGCGMGEKGVLQHHRHWLLNILNAWVKVGDLQSQICHPLSSRLLQAFGETIFVRVRGQKNTGSKKKKHHTIGSLRRDFPS
jgi:hypothetical protein